MLSLTSVDINVLPTGMLAEAKQHLRVTFTRDDTYIQGCIARAIAEVESVTNLSINPAEYQWTPGKTPYAPTLARCHGEYTRIPKYPVRSLQLGGTAVTVVKDELVALVKNASKTGTYTLDVGYATEAQIMPAVRNPILLLTGTLYEQREAVQQGTFSELPDMARRLMSGVWIPAV